MRHHRAWLVIPLAVVFLAVWRMPPSPPIDYPALKVRLAAERDALSERYARADANGRTALIAEARKTILKSIREEIFPAWMGTPWDFNGVTQTPRSGQIACGYFVTTVLRDAGVDLERAKLAQRASLKIIKTLCPSESIKDYGGIEVPELVKRMGNLPKGLYIVGLDIHCGFIDNESRTWWISSMRAMALPARSFMRRR
ncbi:MAG: hypothetical protein U0176_00525 [Bacteroidia bacterium]